MVVTFSRAGYVKRVPLDVYRAQARGGRGIKGSDAKEGLAAYIEKREAQFTGK